MQRLHEVEQVLGLASTYIIYSVWRDGQAVLTFLARRSAGHHAHDAFDDVVDIGEVAAAVAVVVDLDGLAGEQLVGEAKVGHVGATGGTVDGEETQTRRWDVVELAVAVGEELVALFGSGIKAHGIVHSVVGAEGHFLVAAVDGARRSVDQVLQRIVATGLEDVVETNDVALDIGVGVLYRIADTCLGGEVDHYLGLELAEDLVDGGLVSDVAFDELPLVFLARRHR